ncbi:MAG: UDP-N-acetylmuramoyl-L-alanyl-D-glutamate--2,6-diaminopimelate ligase [Chlamydiae bacterium]|nr:UDP-N-acetylmuramoyl-L-alanyl-D-glutamate--2,6-diaminopimelate ligase [Chlamydiota bacterium]
MKLVKLLKDLKVQEVHGSKSIEITGISNHSQKVSPGNLFIAKQGAVTDGNLYTPEAVVSGAVAIVTDMYDPSQKNVTQIVHPNVKEIEGQLVARYYEQPAEELLMIGITGTKGKTTTSYLIHHLLESLGCRSGLMGTVEYLVGEHRYPASHTTPDVLTNHRMLREMIQQNCKGAVMEVSSHALDQNRVQCIDFDIAVFTNLTPDHLDYHKDMDHYIASKRKLFASLKESGTAVYNADSPLWEQILEECSAKKISYAIQNPADVKASDIKLTPLGSTFIIHTQNQQVTCQSTLVGLHNVSNILSTIATALACGYSLEESVAALKGFQQVPGRLEFVKNNLGLKVYVDYAHSGESLAAVLQGLHELKTGRILTVFGCGGDRDMERRMGMARAAEKYSDISIVTTDNPRSEDPTVIIEDILRGFTNLDNVVVEADRRKAIEKAIKMAKEDDLILIAGKGHERFQIFVNIMVEFDDRVVVAEVCQSQLASV